MSSGPDMPLVAVGGPAIPVLTTARLVLRGPRLSDFDDAFAMWRDPAVVRFIGGRPSTREESWARLLRYVGHWALLGHGFWTIETRDTGRFVGECGFADFHRELDPPAAVPAPPVAASPASPAAAASPASPAAAASPAPAATSPAPAAADHPARGFGDSPEHGWALAPWAHGQGFAREAVAASLAWADAHLSADRTVCMIDPANAPSLRLAAAVGYAETARTTYKGEPTILLARPRPR